LRIRLDRLRLGRQQFSQPVLYPAPFGFAVVELGAEIANRFAQILPFDQEPIRFRL
jgi:hypothetical protein